MSTAHDALGTGRLVRVFAALSIALVVALTLAAARARFTEWRGVQDRYNRLARAAGLPTVAVKVRQVWRPELDVTDRCGTCHLATVGEAPIAGEPVFARHPDVPHDVRELGCTVCHGGDGRATRSSAAHEGMLARADVEAGCATCHSGLVVPPRKSFERGRALFATSGCDGCHAARKDLATVGLHGFAADWYAQHAAHAGAAADGSPWSKFTSLAEDEALCITDFLRGSVGAPRLLQARSLAAELGCRGCHRIGGVGGDDGPDLKGEGDRRVADLDLSTLKGPHTLAAWERQHLISPTSVVPQSRMPDLHLDAERADSLTLLVLSQRERAVPEALAPRDRVRVRKLGERDFAVDAEAPGETLYGVFCVACHGPGGAGGRFSEHALVPAIAAPDFLALVDDAFLKRSILDGRPGTRMPAWGSAGTGLHADEVDALVTWLRAHQPTPPTMAQVLAAPVDLPRGRSLFASQCAPCHGSDGEGSTVAPPLAAADNPVLAEDSRIYGTVTVGVAGTAMGSFARLDAAELRSLIAAVHALPSVSVKRTGWAPQKGDATRGAPLFAAQCARCHGEHGEGKDGPALANPSLRAIATEGYFTATILRGRGAMPSFAAATAEHARLSPAEVSDVVAFLMKK